MEALSSEIPRTGPDQWPWPTLPAGTLSAETIRRAMDELWRPARFRPVPGYARGQEPFGTVPVDFRPPPHPWAVEADGWQLVIEDGAITGLRNERLTVPGYCHRCRRPLGPVDWDAADYVFCRRCAKAGDVYTPLAQVTPGSGRNRT
jgi:hypothetical protein